MISCQHLHLKEKGSRFSSSVILEAKQPKKPSVSNIVMTGWGFEEREAPVVHRDHQRKKEANRRFSRKENPEWIKFHRSVPHKLSQHSSLNLNWCQSQGHKQSRSTTFLPGKGCEGSYKSLAYIHYSLIQEDWMKLARFNVRGQRRVTSRGETSSLSPLDHHISWNMIVYPLASLMNLFRVEGKIRRGMITILEGKSSWNFVLRTRPQHLRVRGSSWRRVWSNELSLPFPLVIPLLSLFSP